MGGHCVCVTNNNKKQQKLENRTQPTSIQSIHKANQMKVNGELDSSPRKDESEILFDVRNVHVTNVRQLKKITYGSGKQQKEDLVTDGQFAIKEATAEAEPETHVPIDNELDAINKDIELLQSKDQKPLSQMSFEDPTEQRGYEIPEPVTGFALEQVEVISQDKQEILSHASSIENDKEVIPQELSFSLNGERNEEDILSNCKEDDKISPVNELVLPPEKIDFCLTENNELKEIVYQSKELQEFDSPTHDVVAEERILCNTTIDESQYTSSVVTRMALKSRVPHRWELQYVRSQQWAASQTQDCNSPVTPVYH